VAPVRRHTKSTNMRSGLIVIDKKMSGTLVNTAAELL
jgi:hypothetical protein